MLTLQSPPLPRARAQQVLCAWRYYNGLNLEKNLYSKIATRKFLERGSGYSEGKAYRRAGGPGPCSSPALLL